MAKIKKRNELISKQRKALKAVGTLPSIITDSPTEEAASNDWTSTHEYTESAITEGNSRWICLYL